MEKDLYDTSTLIEARKRKTSLLGSTTILNLIEFPKGVEFKELVVIQPGRADYELALELSAKLLEQGTPVPAVDLVLSAVCMRRQLLLHTRDTHFELVKRVARGFNVAFEESS